MSNKKRAKAVSAQRKKGAAKAPPAKRKKAGKRLSPHPAPARKKISKAVLRERAIQGWKTRRKNTKKTAKKPKVSKTKRFTRKELEAKLKKAIAETKKLKKRKRQVDKELTKADKKLAETRAAEERMQAYSVAAVAAANEGRFALYSNYIAPEHREIWQAMQEGEHNGNQYQVAQKLAEQANKSLRAIYSIWHSPELADFAA
jgi:hypothetical protein